MSCLYHLDLGREALIAQCCAQWLQHCIATGFYGTLAFVVHNPGALLGLTNIVFAVFYQAVDDVVKGVVVVVVKYEFILFNTRIFCQYVAFKGFTVVVLSVCHGLNACVF